MPGMIGPVSGADDTALVRAIAAGDKSALGALYDRYAGTVLALCIRVLGDRAEAEEAMSDVFWQAWQQAERFDPEPRHPIELRESPPFIRKCRETEITQRRADAACVRQCWLNENVEILRVSRLS